ncbi:MAG TPA: efflux transporter outer membrane subunit [Candidatus Sumerlaeota bacterium]|nr:efflux transporter outer membrane subunit [Candidatus Sumerlaeota bacterium]
MIVSQKQDPRRNSTPFRLMGLLLAAGLAAFGSTACTTVGPDYIPPENTAPAAWKTTPPSGLTTENADMELLKQWWTCFNDSTLNTLIGQAIQNNLDLQTAASRVRQARSQRAISQAGLFPTLNFSGSATHNDSRSESQQMGTVETNSNRYSTGFDVNWELDVFGGVRRSVEASDKDLQSREASLYDVLVSLTAEVALNYVNARAYQTRLDLAEANLRIQKETLELVESKFQAELIDELPVQQARYGYENTASQIPALRASLNETLNHLDTLLGQTPGFVHERLEKHEPIPLLPPSVAVGAPSEALRRRPDIRKAEMDLAAQTARIGVAVADLYPKFYLSGSLSRQGTGTLGFRKYATDAWSLGPSVSWNVFDAGATRANVEVQKEVREQDLIAYKSAILNALEEVENKMYAFGQQQARRERLAAAVTAAQNAVQLAQEQYKVGKVAFTDVLNAEQSLVSYQDQVAQSESIMVTDLISLFKALGGGWSPADSPAGPQREAIQEGSANHE